VLAGDTCEPDWRSAVRTYGREPGRGLTSHSDIKYYADKIHAVGGPLVVDATFAPPPLQYPFKWGADCIMHSATKYFGGHSDLLAGVLIVKSKDQWKTVCPLIDVPDRPQSMFN
jgi:cystathionine beta-lyase/cystathionine gamma-synthase